MKIELYDKVKLKSGRIAYIVEILEPGVAYIADVEYEDGTETETIYREDILFDV